jgi:hypothetical protein
LTTLGLGVWGEVEAFFYALALENGAKEQENAESIFFPHKVTIPTQNQATHSTIKSV